MDIFVLRLRQTMAERGYKQADLVKATGFSDGQLSSWYNGKYRPNAEKTAKIAKALGVSASYLFGEDDVPAPKTKEAQTEKPPKIHEVAVLGKVAAGVPISAQEDIIGSIWTDKECFALKVKGDSMSPRIMDDGKIIKCSPDCITNRFARAVKKSGVHPFRFHDLRSFSASAMLSEIKVARSTAKAVHGWKTDRMLDQHYDREIADVKRKDEKKIVRYISKNIHIKRNG